MGASRAADIIVLLVDDEAKLASIIGDHLEQENERFAVRTAGSAREGWAALEAEGVDCIVSDYEMAEQTGLDFLEAVRAEYPNLPFILYTGKGSEAVASRAVNAGVTDYLTKENGTEQYTRLANRIVNAVESYRAKSQLTEAEKRYRRLFDEMNEGGALHELVTDEHGEPVDYEILDVNPTFERILDIPREDAVGSLGSDLYDTDPPPYLDRYASVAQSGDSIQFETYNPAMDRHFHISAYAPAPGQFATLFTDVTERVERERNLERFKKAAEHAGHAIYVTDADGTIEYVNPAFEQITGYGASEAIGEAPRILKSGEMSEAYYEDLWETVLAGQTWEEEVINRKRNGELYYAHQTIAPILDTDGELEAYVAIQTDISDWKEREEELALFQQLMDESNALLFVAEAKSGDLVYANRTAAERLGYAESELESMQVHEIETAFDTFGEWATHLEDIREEGGLRFEGAQERKDGSTFPVEVNLSTVELDEEYVVAIARDITERLERERELELQNERLDKFASVVSHDLRNPLNVAAGRLELAMTDCESEHLPEAAGAIDRSLELIEDMLALAKAGDQGREMEPVDLAELSETCWEHVDTGAATILAEADCRIRADRSQLQQLFENLFRNAVEHGGGDVTITVGSLTDGFYVEDDGPGIPESAREDVFEAGYSTREGGTGFGLSIVKEIVDAHDWEIRLTAGSDGGARFEITGVEYDPA